MKESSKYTERNKNVAKKRGLPWRESLIAGKLDSLINPTRLMLGRAKLKVSQTVIAKKINVSLSLYGGIERAKRKVNQERAENLAKILGIEKNKLFKQLKPGVFVALR